MTHTEMKKHIAIPVDINVVKTTRIKTKHYGVLDIYSVKPCECYSQTELMLMCANNSAYFIYDVKNDCFLMNYFGYAYLTHGCDPFFFQKFIKAMEDNGNGAEYLDACKKYLRRFAALQNDIADMYE